MKKDYLRNVIFTIIIVCLATSACQRVIDLQRLPIEDVSFDYTFGTTKAHYGAHKQLNHLTLYLSVKNNRGENILKEQLQINTQSPSLSDHLSELITQKSQEWTTKKNFKTMLHLSYVLDDMVEDFALKNNNPTLSQLENQGLFIWDALIKSTKRQLKYQRQIHQAFLKRDLSIFPVYSASLNPFSQNNNPIFQIMHTSSVDKNPSSFQNLADFLQNDVPLLSNTVYEGFNRGISSFILNEDIYLNIKNLNKEAEGTDEIGRLFLPILNKMTKPAVSMQELLLNFKDYYRQDLEKGFELAKKAGRIPPEEVFPEFIGKLFGLCLFPFSLFAKGSTHGCCGNYRGPCFCWNPICWIHDKACKCCGKRLCFSGCKPDPGCSSPTPPPSSTPRTRDPDFFGYDNEGRPLYYPQTPLPFEPKPEKIFEERVRHFSEGIAFFKTTEKE